MRSFLRASTTPLFAPEDDQDESGEPSGYPADRLPSRRELDLGEMDLRSAPLGRMHERRPEIHSVLAARAANLVDEHGHGLLMQMLQVRVATFSRVFLLLRVLYERTAVRRAAQLIYLSSTATLTFLRPSNT